MLYSFIPFHVLPVGRSQVAEHMSEACMIPFPLKNLSGLMIIEGCSRQISLRRMRLAQVVLKNRSQHRVLTDGQGAVVGGCCQRMQTRPSADIAKAFQLINIL